MKTKRIFFYFCFFLITAFLLLYGCSWFDDNTDTGSNEAGGTGNGSSGTDGGSPVSVTVIPSSVTLAQGTMQQFSATVTNSYSQSVIWSVEGNNDAATTISQYGLLNVAGNESAGTLTVRAAWSSYSGDTASGTAVVTVVAAPPSNLKAAVPGKTGITLSWSTVINAANYKVYRSTNGNDYSHLGDTSTASYNDTAVTAGSSYYYAVSAVVNGQETGRSAAAFTFAEEYFPLPTFLSSYEINLPANSKHYYRLTVSTGQSYTLTWQDGSGQNTGWNVRCTAWQNDGTEIFRDAYGSTLPKVFTAATTGYVTVEVKNTSGSTGYDYQIYY